MFFFLLSIVEIFGLVVVVVLSLCQWRSRKIAPQAFSYSCSKVHTHKLMQPRAGDLEWRHYTGQANQLINGQAAGSATLKRFYFYFFCRARFGAQLLHGTRVDR